MSEPVNPDRIIKVKDLDKYHKKLTGEHLDNVPTQNSNDFVKSGGVYSYVNNAVSTGTATFRGTSAAGLTEEQFLTWANALTKEANDYCYWKTTDLLNKALFKRYKYNGTAWVFEYDLNNDTVQPNVVLQTAASVTIEPNVLNKWTSAVSALTVAFATPTNSGIVNEYMIQFTCPSDAATVLTLPSGVKWANDDAIEPEAGYTYQISVIDNLAVYAGWEA